MNNGVAKGWGWEIVEYVPPDPHDPLGQRPTLNCNGKVVATLYPDGIIKVRENDDTKAIA